MNVAELNVSVDQGKQGVVLAATNIVAGVVLSATLTDDNFARRNVLATKTLHAQALSIRVAAVTSRANALL